MVLEIGDLAHPLALLLALILDAILGDPAWVYRRIAHPAALIGRLITWVDRNFNRSELKQPGAERLRARGVWFAALLTLGAFLLGWGIQSLLLSLPLGWLFLSLAMSVLIAGRGLYTHVAEVAYALFLSGPEGGRIAIARIVGRDPMSLDQPGICRAAIESLAENFSDAVVAPLFWGLLFGLPGLLAYKAINTADSMIGHLTPRHKDFGWASAKLDDLVNWPASRLSALLLILASLFMPGASARRAMRAVAKDARRHRSPNAGWPEAALAGALGFALAGPRVYHGQLSQGPWMNDGGRWLLEPGDIDAALRLYLRAWALAGLALLPFVLSAH
jgi:adenosylcobinamide-phosphate synthase